MVVVKGDINSIQRCVDNYINEVSKKRIVDGDEVVSIPDPSFNLGVCSGIYKDEKPYVEVEIFTVEEEKHDLELEDDEFISYGSYSENENNCLVNEKELIENKYNELDEENINLVNENEITELGDCEEYCELENDEFIDYSSRDSDDETLCENNSEEEEFEDEFIDYCSKERNEETFCENNSEDEESEDEFIDYEGFIDEEYTEEDDYSNEEGFSWGSYGEEEEVDLESHVVYEDIDRNLVGGEEDEEVYKEVGWDYNLSSTETKEEYEEVVEEVLWKNPLVDEEVVLWGNSIIAEEAHENNSLDKGEVKEEEIKEEVEEIQVPKDLRDFVKIYNNCEMSFALKYFSKKEIDKQLSLGRVFKRKNRLLI